MLYDHVRVHPDPNVTRLTVALVGVDQTGASVGVRVPVEKSLTLFLNGQEIVTAMTIGDYPEDLAVGYFLNQGMLRPDDVITGVDYDEEVSVVVVRTARKTNYEEKLKKKKPQMDQMRLKASTGRFKVVLVTWLPFRSSAARIVPQVKEMGRG